MKTISLTFDGYWRQNAVGGVPARSGVYTVYAGTYDGGANTVSLSRLVYIGESKDGRERLDKHDKWPDWFRQLRSGEELIFGFASIASADRVRAEAALIFKHKPICNVEYKHSFPFPTTTISCRERNALLSVAFTVYDTRSVKRW